MTVGKDPSWADQKSLSTTPGASSRSSPAIYDTCARRSEIRRTARWPDPHVLVVCSLQRRERQPDAVPAGDTRLRRGVWWGRGGLAATLARGPRRLRTVPRAGPAAWPARRRDAVSGTTSAAAARIHRTVDGAGL